MKCYKCLKEIGESDICPNCAKSQIYENIKFNVKGITFKNENGKDIQKEIRKIFLEYEKNGEFEKYSGYTNQEIMEFVTEVAEFEDAKVKIKLEEDIYENKPCIKVYVKKYDNSYFHVGYMPKELVKRYLKLKEFFKEITMQADLVGGKVKQVNYDDITEKESIETIELNYGIEVNLIFYNDYEKYKEEIEKNKKENLEKYKKILEEKKAEEQEKQQEIIKKQKEQKQNAIIGMIINCLIIIIGWNTMPFGIITVLIGIIGFIICLALAL